MKTKFTSNSSLSHAWANQLQDHGRTENMFFEGPIIYSYGEHYEIAHFIINENNEKVCFVNSNGYSNTTAKQTTHVFNAIPDGIKVFKVPFKVGSNGYLNRCHFINISVLPTIINDIMLNIKNLISDQLKAKSNFRYFIDTNTKYSECLEICELFGIDKPGLPLNWFEAEAKYNLLKSTQQQRENAKQQKQILKDQELLQKWLNNEYNGQLYNIPVYLRISKDGQLIETTKGAKVSKIEALKLLSLIRSGNDIKGHKIDGFTVIENNSQDIKIGCHTITWEKINNSKIFN
jgi:hypothetical protein